VQVRGCNFEFHLRESVRNAGTARGLDQVGFETMAVGQNKRAGSRGQASRQRARGKSISIEM
jgi:hypothetical protein